MEENQFWTTLGHFKEGLEGAVDVEAGRNVRVRDPPWIPLSKINDDVYELIDNPEVRPTVELVFFHDLKLGSGSSREVYRTTWISRDNKEFWLLWLKNEFPAARILITSFDAALQKTNEGGHMDMTCTSETLFSSLVGDRARVGQTKGCPVVLVGHGLGGLLMKELCCHAHRILSNRKPAHLRAAKFLANVKGFFFFGTPHHGSLLADCFQNRVPASLMEDFQLLNKYTGRRNEEFRDLKKLRKWRDRGIGESLPIIYEDFAGVVASESTSRVLVDEFQVLSENHYEICRPKSPTSTSYQRLTEFIKELLEKVDQTHEDSTAWAIEDPSKCRGDTESALILELSPLQKSVVMAAPVLVMTVSFIALGTFMSHQFHILSMKEDPDVDVALPIFIAMGLTFCSVGICAPNCARCLIHCMTRKRTQLAELPEQEFECSRPPQHWPAVGPEQEPVEPGLVMKVDQFTREPAETPSSELELVAQEDEEIAPLLVLLDKGKRVLRSLVDSRPSKAPLLDQQASCSGS